MKPRFTFLAGMILAVAAARLIPHPPNFSPIAAMALFAGVSFADKRAAFLVPLVAMLLSDLVLGFSAVTPFIYGSFALIVGLGLWVQRKPSFLNIAGGAFLGAVLFFVITNLGVWIAGGLYPRTTQGLSECFIAAVPFFQNTLVSDFLFSVLLFGSLALAERRFVVLRQEPMFA